MDSGNREMNTEFEHFDVVKDVASDHHYLKKNKCGKVNDSTSLKIMKEWKILKKNLPESIYIQTYEGRIDLLRAVIIGSVGTPYHDGLFFFDIFLPWDYPNHPPEVYYHSFGYRLNPNLYANGFVCLSLINTWSGSKDEKWRKKESTILQLLVSIQGLVLNERPYFNEPGYGVWKNIASARWIKASNSYSENAFVLSCMTMLQIMQKPPQGFAGFVAWHFKERSGSILGAVNAYREGRRVPCGVFQINNQRSSSSLVSVSANFKANMGNILPQLATAFDTIGNVEKLEGGEEVRVDRVREIKKDESGKKALKGKPGKDCNSNIKVKEHVKKEKTGLWGKLFGIVKCFSE